MGTSRLPAHRPRRVLREDHFTSEVTLSTSRRPVAGVSCWPRTRCTGTDVPAPPASVPVNPAASAPAAALPPCVPAARSGNRTGGTSRLARSSGTPAAPGPVRAAARSSPDPDHRGGRSVVRAGEGSVEHVEVNRLGGVRTPIIGRPRPSPSNDASRPYSPSTTPLLVKSQLNDNGERRYTVAQSAAEFGVTRPTISETSRNRHRRGPVRLRDAEAMHAAHYGPPLFTGWVTFGSVTNSARMRSLG